MTDISDGLAGDLGHICERSGVGARLFASALPVAPENRALALGPAGDEWHYALHGGEDYELLFTVPSSEAEESRSGFAARRGRPSRSSARCSPPSAAPSSNCPTERSSRSLLRAGTTLKLRKGGDEASVDHRRLRFRRRRGDSSGPQDIRRTRRLRRLRDHGSDRSEHARRPRRLRSPPSFVGLQIDSVARDIGADAVKIGMLSSAAIIETVAAKIVEHSLGPVVLDPVMVAKGGDPLLREDAKEDARQGPAPPRRDRDAQRTRGRDTVRLPDT